MEAGSDLRGALFVGDPEQVIEKILYQHDLFQHDRFLLQSAGVLPHPEVMKSIELLGTKVAPVVREEIARRTTSVGKLETVQPTADHCKGGGTTLTKESRYD